MASSKRRFGHCLMSGVGTGRTDPSIARRFGQPCSNDLDDLACEATRQTTGIQRLDRMSWRCFDDRALLIQTSCEKPKFALGRLS